ncbi:hypothetical protein NADFUDRAFT_81428 [Nadsonia fulvescens var. elongata DSM 6958]|uniref:37S ribosomal protein MRP2, mitochondrial n=1 Tax=Nadsonia fulvescens var. elongata DSM 6958 TaxID=857566 RepID=A0A1E3PSS2_9ASCO|nr:hypothetical protein NADFUDRAFT_81428 [Nadsonia fulvescens var. elongata DSM 6958]
MVLRELPLSAIKPRAPLLKLKTLIMRDHVKRHNFADQEVTTRALKYIARNTELPMRARMEAQLQLVSMPNYTRFTQVKNRCILSGKGKGVFRDFRLCRFLFRTEALKGNLPGVKRASW